MAPTVLIVPGLREHVCDHWQTLLEADLHQARRPVRSVPAMGRAELDCASRVAAIEREVRAIAGPVVLAAHSGGCVMVAHWAVRHAAGCVRGALLATPPDFEEALPAGYPTLDDLRAKGWLPVPREALPFPSIVAASRNDPLCRFERAAGYAHAWGSLLVDIGEAGHLNPASGHGRWPRALPFIDELIAID